MSDTTTTTTSADIRDWTIDAAHTEVGFSVRHMMISTVKGSFPGVEGAIHLAENFADSTVSVELDASSIDTRNGDRDDHLRSADFFHVEEHPTLTFKSRSVEGSPDSFRITGDLTIRGETREVTLSGKELGRGVDPWGNPRVGFRAETRISRKDFGLTWNQALETGGVLVGDEIQIQIEAQAVPAADD